MTYQYSPLRSHQHRDVAHWRGARGGVRVLSVPSCAAWLQRQSNDACYDFWSDLAIGNRLERSPPPAQMDSVQNAPPAKVLVMQKDPDGSWFIDPWRADEAGLLRPVAANGACSCGAQLVDAPAKRADAAGAAKAVNQLVGHRILAVEACDHGTAVAPGSVDHARAEAAAATITTTTIAPHDSWQRGSTAFIIEIGGNNAA